MTFFIKTYGCQMNVRDSEAVSLRLLADGMTIAHCERDADIVIVNTCSVRRKAEEKALGKLGLLVRDAKQAASPRYVGVIGCMVQRRGSELFDRVPGLAFAIGTRRQATAAEVVRRVLAGEKCVLEAGMDRREEEDPGAHIAGNVSAFVNVLYGCNRRCTYCIVPDVRGAERSRSAEDVLDEIRQLVEGGISEVVLLGQSVMQYGRANSAWSHPPGDGEPCEPLPRLLYAASRVEGLRRIRFTTGHPDGCTEELARVMADVPQVCPHLHLPLQSGCDRILDMMRRGYTVAEYRAAAERLRRHVPDIALTTDIIVGFPTESTAEFEDTRQFMEEIEFDNAFIFKYSPRPGTPAMQWDDDIPAQEKMRRNKQLLAEQERRSLALNRRLPGTAVEVIVEGVSQRNPDRWTGRTGTNKIAVFAPYDGLQAGQIAEVLIENVTAQTLYGRLAFAGPQEDKEGATE